MKKLILVFLISFGNLAFAQDKPSTTDLKLGLGRSSWNGGMVNTFRFEAEFTKKWNRFFSSSVAADFIDFTVSSNSTLTIKLLKATSVGLNAFISPWGNNKKRNFKIGTGLSFMNYEDYRLLSRITDANGTTEINISYKTRWGIGYNVIIDYEYDLGKRYLIGARGILQQRSTVGSSLSYFLRLGIKL